MRNGTCSSCSVPVPQLLTFSYDSSLSVFPGESWAMATNLPPAAKWDRGREKHEACGM